METLPDYLAPGLALVFIGINPSLYSAEVGHYFARSRNRFWQAFNQAGLTPEPLSPETDYRILEFGMGFSDLVKRPTRSASELTAQDFRQGALALKEKLLRYRPRLVCFQGIMARSRYLQYAEGLQQRVRLGLQTKVLGAARVFVVPNPSPANAAFTLEVLVGWYGRLREARDAPSVE